MTAPLDFYFDLVCPFAYLASTQVEAFAARVGATIAWRPVLLGGVLKAVGTDPNFQDGLSDSKRRHVRADAVRFAERYGVPFAWHPRHPVRTLLPMRVLAARCGPDGVLPASEIPAVKALYHAHWVRHTDTDRPDVVAAILDAAGYPGAEWVEAADSAKARLKDQSDAAAARGVFGVPSFVTAAGDVLFGQDRWHLLERLVTGRRAADTPALPAGRGRVVDVWFDFTSPYAYLAAKRVEAVAASAGGTVRWQPMLLGGLFKALGQPDSPISTLSAAKAHHLNADLARWAEHLGVPFRWPTRFPARTMTALRVALLLEGADRGRWVTRVFTAYWAEDQDIGDPAVLAVLLAGLGLDAALLEQAAGAKQALMDATSRAVSLGVFGAPTFLVDGELFWGQDRLDFVADALRAEPLHDTTSERAS